MLADYYCSASQMPYRKEVYESRVRYRWWWKGKFSVGLTVNARKRILNLWGKLADGNPEWKKQKLTVALFDPGIGTIDILPGSEKEFEEGFAKILGDAHSWMLLQKEIG